MRFCSGAAEDSVWYSVTRYVPINPVAVVFPQCGARTGKACKMSRRDLAESHIERLVAAATKDIVARKELGKNTHYAERMSAS